MGLTTTQVFCHHCLQVQPCTYHRATIDYEEWHCTMCGQVADSEVIAPSLEDDDEALHLDV